MIIEYDMLISHLKEEYSFSKKNVSIDEIIDEEAISEYIYNKTRGFYVDPIKINSDVVNIQFDSINSLGKDISNAIKIINAVKEACNDKQVNASISITNNTKIDKNNLEQILGIKKRLEFENINLVFSEYLANNESHWTLEEVLSTNSKIDNIVDEIKSKNLSPLESILLAYNFVTNIKPYKESINKDALSRSIYAIMHNDYVVCLGYAQLFEAIVNKLEIPFVKAYTNCLENEKRTRGHANNIIYLKDDKYGIDGYYMFDATRDCFRETLHEDKILDHYKFAHFLIPFTAIKKMEQPYKASRMSCTIGSISIGKDDMPLIDIELFADQQKGIDINVDELDFDNYEMCIDYFYNKKSKPFDKSKVVELFTTTFPDLSEKEFKNMFRQNELDVVEYFDFDSDELMFYDQEFENDIDKNKIRR